ncbi:hypothetical protein C2845_PM13G09830 [Panicum miliaceum]|uniref:Uncharacterized protein n=1 Tax=Panicum miliaceum TaxID=4540 RepID=A0A3L6RHC1_PANMI|nr:hypothetical protein C2845_PM13G09830 [Panicum miliaceum]
MMRMICWWRAAQSPSPGLTGDSCSCGLRTHHVDPAVADAVASLHILLDTPIPLRTWPQLRCQMRSSRHTHQSFQLAAYLQQIEIKESDTGLTPPSQWDLVSSDKHMMQEE